MKNILSSIKKIATIHDAAVDTEIINSNKIGDKIPETTDKSYTTAALKSLVEAKHLGKRVKGLGFKVAILSITVVATYIESQKNKKLPIQYKLIGDRKCKIKPDIKRKSTFNHSFAKSAFVRQESLTEAVKRQNLSAKKN